MTFRGGGAPVSDDHRPSSSSSASLVVRDRGDGAASLVARGLRPRPGHGAAFIAPPAANPPALRLLPLPGDIGLVAARELRDAGPRPGLPHRDAARPGHRRRRHRDPYADRRARRPSSGSASPGPLSAPIRAAVVADGPAVGTASSSWPSRARRPRRRTCAPAGSTSPSIDGRQVVVDKATRGVGHLAARSAHPGRGTDRRHRRGAAGGRAHPGAGRRDRRGPAAPGVVPCAGRPRHHPAERDVRRPAAAVLHADPVQRVDADRGA